MHGAAEGECGVIAIKLIIKSKNLLSPLRMRKVFLIFLLLTTHFNSAMSAEPHHALTLIKNSIGMELILEAIDQIRLADRGADHARAHEFFAQQSLAGFFAGCR